MCQTFIYLWIYVNLSAIQLQSSHNLPPRPDAPPFLPTEENTSKLEIWLLDAFLKTTFNTDIEPLPLMTGKKHHIYITENAEPYITHSPIPIPHHWKEEVKRQLDWDVDMGIVRKVSVGEADEWCSQMVVVGKKDSKPRRTGFSKPKSFLQTRNSIHLHHML